MVSLSWIKHKSYGLADFYEVFFKNTDHDWTTDSNQSLQAANTQIFPVRLFIEIQPSFKQAAVDQLILFFHFSMLIFVILMIFYSPVISVVWILFDIIMTPIVTLTVNLWHFENGWGIHFDKIKIANFIILFVEQIWYETCLYFCFEGELWWFDDSFEHTIKCFLCKLLKLCFDFRICLRMQIIINEPLRNEMKQLKNPKFGLNMMWRAKCSKKIYNKIKERLQAFRRHQREVAIRQVQVKKVTNLILFLQYLSRVMPIILWQIYTPFTVIFDHLFYTCTTIYCRHHFDWLYRAVDQYSRVPSFH